MNFEGTQSLITGASSGIGLAVAERLLHRDSTVHSFDVKPLSKNIVNFTTHTVDVRNAEQVSRGMTEIRGRLNILFNNAGVLVRGGLFDVSHNQFRTMLEINMLGSWLALKTALEQNKLTEDATVVQMCSTVGGPPDRRMSAPKIRPYSLSKSLVHEFINALRTDLPGLHVKAVYPCAVKTPMTMAGFATEEEYDQQAIANWGVVSTAEDIADKIIKLIEIDAMNLVWDPNRKEYVFD